MKISTLVLIAVAALVTFTACQKELNFDNGGVSFGTLKSAATGDCLPSTLYGIYKKDSVLTTDNYIDVQVQVSIPGTFDIKSDTIHGFSFSKTGNVGGGLNTIRLYASGKPDTTGTFTFTIKYDSSICKFDVTVVASTAGGANYTLGGAPGTCSNGGVPPGGTYTVGVAMTPANTVTMSVYVIAIGTWSLNTTANGVTFAGSGTFTSPGVQTITLTGSGTPSATPNTYTYNVSNGSSNCSFTITYAPSGSPAMYTLGGAPSGCTGVVLNGTYTAGTALISSNYVKINVIVTTPGTFSITTTTANGISFSASGVFTSTLPSPQSVTLIGSGTPAASGTNNYTATGNGSSCIFSVPVAAGPTSTDYYPLTNTTWWSYDDANLIDTVVNTVIGAATYNGNSYKEIEENSPAGTIVDTAHIRKSGNDYHQWTTTDGLSYQFAFDNPVFTDIIILKENAPTNTTWSNTYSGTFSGIAASVKYDFKIASANTSITVNGVTYNNVIHVTYDVSVSAMGLPFTIIETDENYYAKGIGPLKPISTQTGGTVISQRDIRNYRVF